MTPFSTIGGSVMCARKIAGGSYFRRTGVAARRAHSTEA